jgi:hypothetical protein
VVAGCTETLVPTWHHISEECSVGTAMTSSNLRLIDKALLQTAVCCALDVKTTDVMQKNQNFRGLIIILL